MQEQFNTAILACGMQWVREFYAMQDLLTKIYQQDPAEPDGLRAQKVKRCLSDSGGKVLELGCGGGQTASKIAELGFPIIAVDLNPSAVRHAILLASQCPNRLMTVIEADFYSLDFDQRFDVVCYFDGFGIGEDADQQRLLRRIASWLEPSGHVLIDVYTPSYWSSAAGVEMQIGSACRRYDFDAAGRRLLDSWWEAGHPEHAVTQSLRCYAPEELQDLVAGTGLVISELEPGGAMDYELNTYHPQVPLDRAMNYTAYLRKSTRQAS